MSEGTERRWPPPLWAGWLILSGAPILAGLSWAFYREDGLFSVLLNCWYSVVCLVFGIICIRAAWARGHVSVPDTRETVDEPGSASE